MTMAELPYPYLVFLGDTTEPIFAKTAFGLRDWAPERCIGAVVCDFEAGAAEMLSPDAPPQHWRLGRRTNPAIRCAGVSLNTSKLEPAAAPNSTNSSMPVSHKSHGDAYVCHEKTDCHFPGARRHRRERSGNPTD